MYKRALLISLSIFIVLTAIFIFFHVGIRDFVFELQKQGLPQETRLMPSPRFSTSSKVSVLPVVFAGINLAVPFSVQAPFGDWSLPYEDACEETSAILVDKFYKDQPITPEIANQEILKLVDWEKHRFGYYENTTAAETAVILKEYFGYKRVDVLYGITMDDIKSQILAGRPVIVPLDGRLVGNPYYTQPGPVYHMLVIKGITKNGDFITNDVGTRRGQNYVYNSQVLFNAIHDAPKGGVVWPQPDPEAYIKSGKKAMIVVYPN
jgi:hypothetical protein